MVIVLQYYLSLNVTNNHSNNKPLPCIWNLPSVGLGKAENRRAGKSRLYEYYTSHALPFEMKKGYRTRIRSMDIAYYLQRYSFSSGFDYPVVYFVRV